MSDEFRKQLDDLAEAQERIREHERFLRRIVDQLDHMLERDVEPQNEELVDLFKELKRQIESELV